MKATASSLVLVLISALAYAQPRTSSAEGAGVVLSPELASSYESMFKGDAAGIYVSAELESVETALADRSFGDLTLAELAPYRDRLSVAAQKDAFIKEIKLSSFSTPGFGQFWMGMTGAGVGFLSLHMALLAGSIVGPFFLLPEDLRQINYFETPLKDISDAYASHSYNDFSLAFAVSGAITLVDTVVRFWSASAAGSEARNRVDQGRQTFTPKFGLGYLGFGMSY
jgi:hypothetical protein